jgi:uncharacterized repeat protein (TIGR01451 family)
MRIFKKMNLLYIFVVSALLATFIQMAAPISAARTSFDPQAPSLAASTPGIHFTMIAKLVNDINDDGSASEGDTIQYILTISNLGSGSATEVTLYDTPDASTTLVVKSVTKTQGRVITGNTTGDTKIQVYIGTVPVNGSATVTFYVTINSRIKATQIVNQATASGSNFSLITSDDPNTSYYDATITQINTTIKASGDIPRVPGVSHWGIGIMVVLFGGMMVGIVRKKRTGKDLP